ncbi:MAG: DUF4190 domain-containing protein [Eubacteriaceae bacterium]|nr:DUF4190 domain-containing protein [Eubacteriaceae bacterium]
MYCKNCGSTLPDSTSDGEFCTYCGSKVTLGDAVQNQTYQAANTAVSNVNPTATNTFAIAGFVLGLISWFLNLWGIIGTLAIVFSALGLSKLKLYNNKGKVFAIIGLISGICNVLYFVIRLIYIIGLY